MDELVYEVLSKSDLAGGKLLEMPGHITGPEWGDCNRCHTQNGDEGAPGRLILPP